MLLLKSRGRGLLGAVRVKSAWSRARGLETSGKAHCDASARATRSNSTSTRGAELVLVFDKSRSDELLQTEALKEAWPDSSATCYCLNFDRCIINENKTNTRQKSAVFGNWMYFMLSDRSIQKLYQKGATNLREAQSKP
jgi:hypothetical protein